MAPTAIRLPASTAPMTNGSPPNRSLGAINPVAGTCDDWTNWQRFAEKLNQYAWNTFDATVWVIISVGTIVFMFIAGIAFYYIIEPLVKFIAPFFSTPFKIQKGNTNISIPPSLVSAGTPDFFYQYTRYLGSAGVWESLGQKLADSKTMNEPAFDADVARFLLRLSALAYEQPDVVAYFASQWQLEHVKILRTNFACHAYYSTRYPFAVVSFKGTSPFDLSEWLTDVMMVKVRPDGGVIPGQVHEGFYNTFQWDSPSTSDESWSRRYQCEIDDIFNLLKTAVLPKVSTSSTQNINLWITGHSLGAALATIFLSHLTYLALSPFSNNVRVHAYTFGSPRVGDSTFVSITKSSLAAAKASCFRVVNANDAVAALPLCATAPISPHRHILKISRGKAPNMLTDFEHVGIPVTLGYDHVIRVNVDRTWSSIGKNTFWYLMEWPQQFYDFARRRETIGGLMSRTFEVFPYDHTPSEYDRHLCPKAK